MAIDAPIAGEELLAEARRTAAYLERRDYRGHDPFDALSSPLFRLPGLDRARLPRFAAQQVVRRLPVDVRALLRVPEGLNPVTVALALQAAAHLHRADPAGAAGHRERALAGVARLVRLRSRGYSGACWGYDFDWEARYARIPAWTPTIVATGIVTNALHAAYRLLGFEDALALCESATRFVLDDLPRTPGPDGSFCWSYSPVVRDAVLNASMKGARLCAQVHAATGDPALADAASRAVAFVAAQQDDSGAWPYAVGDRRRWADNFHTAYVLDCLDAYRRGVGDATIGAVIDRGYAYYRARFFTAAAQPKYFDDRLYPIDATACAQSVITLCRFGDRAQAARVAAWTERHLGLGDGSYAYQVRRRYTVRIPYIRWSAAWMGVALAVLADAAEAP